MTKVEFDKLKSKNDWRRKFAVRESWNINGEVVFYVVPPSKPLRVWEGKAASKMDKSGAYVVDGGGSQVALDPDDLDMAYLERRKRTEWGYQSANGPMDMVGVPVLKNNWRNKDGN